MDTRKLLISLLAIDATFVLLHLFHEYSSFLDGRRFSLTTDRGYAELFGYLKWIAIILGLLYLTKLLRDKLYLAWAALFFYLLLDDAFFLHEQLGRLLGQEISIKIFGLDPQNTGELLYFICSGLVVLVWLGYNYWKGGSVFRSFSRKLGLLFGVLVFFGVLVDLGRSFLPQGYFYSLTGVLEDGGELMVASFIMAFINSRIN